MVEWYNLDPLEGVMNKIWASVDQPPRLLHSLQARIWQWVMRHGPNWPDVIPSVIG